MRWLAPPSALASPASRSAWARLETSRPRSRRWPSGSPGKSAPSPPGSSTPARTSVRSSRRCSCRGSRFVMAGAGPSSSPARAGLCGCCSGWRSTAGPRSTRPYRRRSSRTSGATRRRRPPGSRGPGCCRTARPGRLPSASSSPIRSGGSTSTGYQTSCRSTTGSTSRASARRWLPSIWRPMSAASGAAGSPRR